MNQTNNSKTGRPSAPDIDELLSRIRTEGFKEISYMTEQEEDELYKWVDDVIQGYSATLERYNELINDIRVLSYPKEDIKLAIILAISSSIVQGEQTQIELLKTSYVFLSSFQEIDPKDLKKLNIRTPDAMSDKLKGIPNNASELTSEQKETLKGMASDFVDSHSVFDHYMKQVNEENQELSSGINRAVEIFRNGINKQ